MKSDDAQGAIRANQKRRTRQDLLRAASRLMQRGFKPSLEDIADEALVSRATAYRYFANAEAVLYEAALEIAIPDADALFKAVPSSDPVVRLHAVDTVLHDVVLKNEVPLRMMLMHSIQRAISADESPDMPRRQNRRAPLIAAALAPAESSISPELLTILRDALALIVGTEAMIVCKDVLQLSDSHAREVKRWAIRALIEAAMKHAAAPHKRKTS